jgi:hypothetical protein
MGSGSGGAGAAVGAASLSMASSSAGTPIPSRPVRADTDSVHEQAVFADCFSASVCLRIYFSFPFSARFFPTLFSVSTTSFWLTGPIFSS